MVRRRPHRTYRTNWSGHHGNQRSVVSRAYGGLDKDILEAFYSINDGQLRNLFGFYGKHYGDRAKTYAKKTYESWKSGDVQPSGQTVERLIEILPRVLDFSGKCDLLRKLRQRFRHKENHSLKVKSHNWLESVAPLVRTIVSKAYTAELPSHVEEKLTWLASGDMQTAKALLAEAEVQEGKNAVAFLRREIETVNRLVADLPGKKRVEHTIKLPYGTINLKIERSKVVENDNEGLVKQPSSSIFKPNADDILDQAFENLTPDQVREVSGKAAEEGLRLKVDQKRSQQRFTNAQRDISNFVDNADRMDARGHDYSMSARVEGASSTIDIHVSRRKSWTAMIWAVVGILALLGVLYVLRPALIGMNTTPTSIQTTR